MTPRTSIALTATGAETNGLHSRGNTAHLNLSRSMADVWASDSDHWKPKAPNGRTRTYERQNDFKIPYAGRER